MTESMLFYIVPQMLAFGFDWGSGETLLQEKTTLFVSGIRTQVLADSIAVAARALNHCMPLTFFKVVFTNRHSKTLCNLKYILLLIILLTICCFYRRIFPKEHPEVAGGQL